MSYFVAKKLDIHYAALDTTPMPKAIHGPERTSKVALSVRQRIERKGERLWRLKDFDDLPCTAVAQALSRLKQKGIIQRLSKGVYYRARPTSFGQSRPNPATLERMAREKTPIFPSGLAAASMLGFTTQTAKRNEVATHAGSLPRKLIGGDTIVHTRRPDAWARLSSQDAALLDFLRQGAKFSELSPEATVRRTEKLLSQPGTFERLLKISRHEPPRVRAMLGAFGEQIGQKPEVLRQLRASLNSFSKFDFGMLAALPNARAWQAKGNR